MRVPVVNLLAEVLHQIIAACLLQEARRLLQEFMTQAISRVLIMVLRFCWVLGMASGVAALLGVAVPVPAHMFVGALVVAGLLMFAALAVRLGRVLALGGVLVAGLLAGCGWLQYDPALLGGASLMPWMAAHVLLAVAAMGLSEMMAKKIRLASVA